MKVTGALVTLALILTCSTAGYSEDLSDQPFDHVWAYYDGVAQIRKDGKIGLLDTMGNILVRTEYDHIAPQSVNGLRKVWRDGSVGMLDEKGNIWQDRMFDTIEWFSSCNKLLLFREEGEEYYGLMDINGNTLHSARWYTYRHERFVPELYGQTSPELPSFLVVRDKEGGFGVLNDAGKYIIPIMDIPCEDIGKYSNGRLLIWLGDSATSSFGVVDESGIIIDAQWDEIRYHGDALIAVRSGEKWGFVNEKNEIIVPVQWYDVGRFENGFAPVQAQNGMWGFCSISGELLFEPAWHAYKIFQTADDRIAIMNEDGMWGLLPVDGGSAVNFVWESIYYVSGKTAVVEKNGKLGLVEIFKEEDLLYDDMIHIADELFNAKREDEWGCVDIEGNVVTPFVFESIETGSVAPEALDWLPCTYLERSEGCAYIDLYGTIVLKGDWDEGEPFWGQYACVRKDGKWGMIDRTGSVVVPFVYDFVYGFDGETPFMASKWSDGQVLTEWIGPDFEVIAEQLLEGAF